MGASKPNRSVPDTLEMRGASSLSGTIGCLRLEALVKAGTAAVLVGLLSLACAGPGSQTVRTKAAPESRRLVNLRRAAQYPWTDQGACVVREAAGEWKALVERCFQALDLSRIQFRDLKGQCPVAQEDAASVEEVVLICLLVQPELAVGAIVVVGVVAVASEISDEIEKEEARAPVATKPCWCSCLGKPDPNWNPDDPNHMNPNAGWRAHPAECRTECKLRAFPSYQCL